MKKLFFLFVSFLATTCLWAYDFQSGDLYYNITSKTTVEVTYLEEYSSENYSGLTTATIPETVTCNGTTYSVTSIGYVAFRACSSLTSITIPNSVTDIGFAAFSDCISLTSITIPNHVTSIGEYAFYFCSSLTSITIPNSVTSIGTMAFSDCNSLTSIVVEKDNTTYDSHDNCNAIIETATNTLIAGCQNTIIPNSVTSIGEYAFSGCSSLTSITIPNSVTSIGGAAFSGCSALTSITIPNSVTNIGGWVFAYCSALTSITIPNSVTKVGESVFYGCSALESVVLSDNITELPSFEGGGYVQGFFSECSSLSSITIPNSVTSIGGCAFSNCSSLTSVVWNAKNYSGSDYSDNPFSDIRSQITSFTFGNEVEHIPAYLCYGMDNLTSITIPESVTSIGGRAFQYCSSLSVIICKAETPASLGSSVFNGVSKSIPVYVPCSCIDSYRSSDWSCFYNIQEPLAEYSIDISTQNSQMGTTQVDKNTICGNSISATANYGYHFVQWSDGNTDNPRSLELTQDTVLTAEFAPNNYTLSVQSDNSECGTTSGDITTAYLDYVTISATANYGYHFSHWNDYNYDNPRQVQVTEDKTYIAYFDKNTYSITKHYNSEQGYVSGSSSGEYLDNITLTAEANYGYHFVRWSDGNTENPRHFVLTQDTTFAAEFAQTFSGQCGDNLYWSYQNNSLTISGFGDMYNERPWGLFINEIQNVVLPNGITHIGDDAFNDCTELSEITIPYTVISIGDYAFAGCRKLVHVNCYAINPPIAETTSFANYNVYLKVPCDNLQDYQLDMVFGSFKYIQCMEADSENVPTDDVVVTPGTNDVTITWPTAENADTYTIVIQKGNEVFCTLTFNAEGQLLNIAFAPGRDGNRPAQYAEQTVNGYRFTVTSLESGTKYGYNIDVKDASNKTIKSHSGEFTTQSTTAVDNVTTNNANIQKIIRDGQLIIIRNGVEYNAMGQEM